MNEGFPIVTNAQIGFTGRPVDVFNNFRFLQEK